MPDWYEHGGADIANKMTGLEYSLETITMLTNIIISNDAIERFIKCMVRVFTTVVVIPARIPVEITFGKRMGKRGYLLTEGQQKGGMYTIELEQDLNRNTSATKSKSDPKVAWKKKRTRERPYNFRLLETAKMGIGYRDPNFKFPKWKTAFNSHANKDGDDVFDERWTSCIVHCTACGELLKAKSNVLLHPRLGVVICNKCMYVYKHGNFNINPETGSEEFCRWCGDGGTVMGCDHCNHVFCQTCIHRNFGAQEVIRINEVDDWSCFLCDHTKIQGLQDSAQITMKYLKKKQGAQKKNDLSIFEESPIELFYPEVSKQLLSKNIVVEDVSNGNEKEPIRASNYSKKRAPSSIFLRNKIYSWGRDFAFGHYVSSRSNFELLLMRR